MHAQYKATSFQGPVGYAEPQRFHCYGYAQSFWRGDRISSNGPATVSARRSFYRHLTLLRSLLLLYLECIILENVYLCFIFLPLCCDFTLMESFVLSFSVRNQVQGTVQVIF